MRGRTNPAKRPERLKTHLRLAELARAPAKDVGIRPDARREDGCVRDWTGGDRDAVRSRKGQRFQRLRGDEGIALLGAARLAETAVTALIRQQFAKLCAATALGSKASLN